jgi:HK97 family phage major capsid protein
MEQETELKSAIDALGGDVHKFIAEHKTASGEMGERLTQIEQKLSKSTVSGFGGDHETKSIGERVCESEQIKSFYANRTDRSGKVLVGDFFEKKSAIITDGSLFAQPQRVGPIQAVWIPLRLRDIIKVTPATSNLIEFIRESSSTNAAAPQGKGSSPQVYENVAKSESALGFQLMGLPVQTIAHWIPASRQVLEDSAQLLSFLNSRMIHFLKIIEENQLLNGTGSGGDLDGLLKNATTFTSNSPADTRLDALAHAIEQIAVSGFAANGVILHPTDWTAIQLSKAVTSGEYLMSPDPRLAGPPSVWGVPVVQSVKIAQGDFLVGDFQVGCELFDRMQSTVEVSREHADFFVKNMCAVLAELREALVVFQPDAFRQGAF